MTFPASPELFLEIISPCSSNRSHSGGPQPSALDLQTQDRHSTDTVQTVTHRARNRHCCLLEIIGLSWKTLILMSSSGESHFHNSTLVQAVIYHVNIGNVIRPINE